MLCTVCHMRNHLHPGCSGADDGDSNVTKFVEATCWSSTGEVVVPSTRMKRPSFKLIDAFNTRKLGPMERSGSRHDEPSKNFIVSSGRNSPTPNGVVPMHLGHFGSQDGGIAEVIVIGNSLHVFQDLWGSGVALTWHHAKFFEQGHIDIGLDVTLRSGILIPIPRPTESATFFNDANVAQANLPQFCSREQSAKPTTYDQRIYFDIQRLSIGECLIAILRKVGILASNF